MSLLLCRMDGLPRVRSTLSCSKAHVGQEQSMDCLKRLADKIMDHGARPQSGALASASYSVPPPSFHLRRGSARIRPTGRSLPHLSCPPWLLATSGSVASSGPVRNPGCPAAHSSRRLTISRSTGIDLPTISSDIAEAEVDVPWAAVAPYLDIPVALTLRGDQQQFLLSRPAVFYEDVFKR